MSSTPTNPTHTHEEEMASSATETSAEATMNARGTGASSAGGSAPRNRSTRGSRTVLTLLILVLLPALCGIIATAGARDAQRNTQTVPVAIVNQDTIVTLPTGQQLPGGRQIIAALTASHGEELPSVTWSVVTEETAEKGMLNGTYAATLLIPSPFSAQLADVIQGKSQNIPAVQVRTAPGAHSDIGTIASVLAQAAAREFGSTMAVTFISTALSRTGEMADGLQKAADGAGQIASGQDQATDGARQLSTGTAQLATGAGQLSSGARQLADGTAQASDGITRLHEGITQPQSGQVMSLQEGAHQLASGVDQYTRGVEQLHSGITQRQSAQAMSLQEGARALADGAEQMKALVDQLDPQYLQSLPGQFEDSRREIEGLIGQNSDLGDLMSRCNSGDSAACTELDQRLTAAIGEATVIAGRVSTLVDYVNRVRPLVPQLTAQTGRIDELVSGTRQLADGIDQLADGTAQLSGAGGQLRSGSSGLASGIDQLADGSGQAASGLQQLSGGASQLADGASQLSGGVGALNSGASQLSDGLTQLSTGAHTLADSLLDAKKQVPVYSEEQARAIGKGVASPIGVESDLRALSSARAWASAAVAVAAWLSALVSSVLLSSAVRRRLDAPTGAVRMVAGSLWRPAAVALVSMPLLVGALLLSGVSAARPGELILVACALDITCAAIHEALFALCGHRWGTLVSLCLLALQVLMLSPWGGGYAHGGALASLASAVPLPAADLVMRSAIAGDASASAGGTLVFFVLIVVVSLVVAVGAVGRHRRVTLDNLRAA